MKSLLHTASVFIYALSSCTINTTPPDISFEEMLCSNQPSYWLPNPLAEQDANLNDKLFVTESIPTRASQKKPWTFIVYMAGDNDLRSFASRNIRQMAAIGSNENINILVHLDIRINNNYKVTRRYLIEKNKVTHVNANDPKTQRMDSGDEKTLISCCEWAINNYPADNYALIFWNHGTGVLDPERGRVINPSSFFEFNPATNMFDLDRSIGFLEAINEDERGICWDDSTGHYLTNQKLDRALEHVRTNLLNGGKLQIIGFDACLMSMLEVANIAKKHADFMVSSQEVELGTGWNYAHVLAPFTEQAPTAEELAQSIVHVYKQSYQQLTKDYTLSALKLQHIALIEKNIDDVARILLECLNVQQHNSVKNSLKASRNKLLCTHFDEPSYIDMHHFYENLEGNLQHFNLSSNTKLITILREKLIEGKKLIKQAVVANVVGPHLSKAQGISVYFPERSMHSSYAKTTFAQSNNWIVMLKKYLFNR